MSYDVTALEKNMFNPDLCCASIMLKTAFDLEDVENEGALKAIEGLCGGMYSGLVCGVLTGASCMVSYLAEEDDAAEILPQLTAWFKQYATEKYGSMKCSDIKHCPEDIANCQELMHATYQKAMELLEDKGYEYE